MAIAIKDGLMKISERNLLIAEVQNFLSGPKGLKFFSQLVQPLFEKFPKLESFAWNQGEYYNDEDYNYLVMTNADCLEINSIHISEYEDATWEEEASEAIETVLDIFNEDDHRTLWNCAKVVVYKDKIEIEEFEGY